MIRNLGALSVRTAGAIGRRSMERPPPVSGKYFQQYNFMSTLSQPMDQEDSALPPNLTIDRRSSFAPKETPILVPPPKKVFPKKDEDADQDNKDVGEETEDDYDDDEDEARAVDEKLDAEDEPRFVVPLPERLRTDIHYVKDGSVSGTLWLEESVFGADPIRVDLIKQSVDYIRNKIRGRRKAKTKTISEVSGSGRKVRQQKGSGSARAGHSRPAHWRGGAKAHGPKNTVDYGKVKMNKKARRLAMVSTLSQKLKEGNLIVVDNLQLETHKTGDWANVLDRTFGIGREGSSALILDHYLEPEEGHDDKTLHAAYNGVPINLWVASGNLYKIKVANIQYANVYEILKKEKLMLTLSALEQIESRWKE